MRQINKNDFKNITPISSMEGEDNEETFMFHKMLLKAQEYFISKTNNAIDNIYFGGGVGNVIAIFLFENLKINKKWTWVIVGDLPSACLDAKDKDSPASALYAYCTIMENWIENVTDEKSLETCYPVTAEPTIQNADLLLKRVNFIKTKIIPWLEDA